MVPVGPVGPVPGGPVGPRSPTPVGPVGPVCPVCPVGPEPLPPPPVAPVGPVGPVGHFFLLLGGQHGRMGLKIGGFSEDISLSTLNQINIFITRAINAMEEKVNLNDDDQFLASGRQTDKEE